MKLSRVAAVLAAALLFGQLPACTSNNSSSTSPRKAGAPGPKVAFVSNNPEDFWNIAEAGCRKAEEEFGCEVIFRRPSPGEAARQQELLNVLLQQGVKAVAVSVIDPQTQSAYLDEVAQKVKLVTVDNDAPKSGRLAYIGTDNYSAGRTVGRLIKEAMPDGGVLAIFVGMAEPLNARQRHQGVLDELVDKPIPADTTQVSIPKEKGQTFGKFRLHDTYFDQADANKAKERVIDAITSLQSETKPVCFVGLWAYNPPAILAALKDKEKLGKIKVVAFDEMPTTLDGVRDGTVYATVVQDPYNFGYQSVKLMADLVARGDAAKPANPLIYIPERVVMKEAGKGPDGKERLAVQPFREELEQRLRKK